MGGIVWGISLALYEEAQIDPEYGFRRIFSIFEKLDVVLFAFLHFALLIEELNCVNTPWFIPRNMLFTGGAGAWQRTRRRPARQ